MHRLLLLTLYISTSLVVCKNDEGVCMQPANGVGAFPCESKPSREPHSLQFSKAQSKTKTNLHVTIHQFEIR